ncbi:sensor histidine kinase [Nocardia sp. XZ_19_369]|uniref:sensor histidine kinase n=1 Tax=Nocardia sp. XZ_19_369 TaxID=2769487 RepID=UPI0018909865|nr:histidine kinase [Nocardia sp. XZ_19_369]
MSYWSSLSTTTQDALVAVFAFAVGLLLYLADLATLLDAPGPPLLVRSGVLAAMCVATFFRRRRPVPALVCGLGPLTVDALLTPSVPIWLLCSDLIYASVLYGRGNQPRYVAIVCATVFTSAALATLVITGEWRTTVLAATLSFAFMATPIWWATTVSSHKAIASAERIRARAMSLVAELDRRAAIAEERKTMARDLHDVIAGHLSAIAIQAEATLGVLARRSESATMADLVGSIRAESVHALQEMRTMIGLLGSDGGNADDPAAPRRLAQLPLLVEAACAAGVTVRVRSALDDVDLPSAVDQAAYRIVQEALTNAMKHAPGQPIDIEMRTQEVTLDITVRNPAGPMGNLAASSAGKQRGLVNMRERATALGGAISAGPVSGGWEVAARLPLTTPQVGGHAAITK